MHGIEIVLVSLLLSVVVLGTIARLVHIPYPIVLVIGGLVMGFVLGPDDTVTLDPELVLVIFLPPLLYSSAFFANLHDIRSGIRVVTVQAVGLVLVTMCTARSSPPRTRSRRPRSCAACASRGGWCR
jgi:NhaP-type Na+/H+ or K+/H+ antiporter